MNKADIPRCATCQHWDAYKDGSGQGECEMLHGEGLEAVVFGQEDAQLGFIRTYETFSCINHSELKTDL
jgi:hypothetical protein